MDEVRLLREEAHPRSRGENLVDAHVRRRYHGSSPLTRGKRPAGWHPRTRIRLIPAHAGKTQSLEEALARDPAHPRSRGENIIEAADPISPLGSSPLTRGKLGNLVPVLRLERLIPAHAGKTCSGRASRRTGAAHPRSRGENRAAVALRSGMTGSSPLTRGKPALWALSARWWGLIPAHAGKTLPDLRFYCADRSDLGNP